ncbi:inorganic phosphate transporter [Halorientalis salina]|uniref:inorganic phosphate transporter n=1 Tax=Halorientalis salina TaxID=2932266 RepID=UPI0010AD2573|nr:inorganic phosphate transporter [Halorientalis salina]
MSGLLLVAGVLIACFVAYNVGGATTGPAFGPAVGADAVSKPVAAALMSVCFALGAWTLGRRVVDTLGRDLVHDPGLFTLPVSIVVLFFIGGALLVGNLSGAPSSTSMTAVGAIAGLGVASGELAWAVVGEIVAWWFVSPVLGFWTAVMIGRYAYPYIDRVIAIDQTDGPLLSLEGTGAVPRPALGPNTTRRELAGTVVVVGIGCLMAFSSGASNIANAVAPLVGSGELAMNTGILVGSAAVAVGAFTIARRTMDTLGSDITDLPLTAAIVVAVISSLIVILLSTAGIPASFVIIATMCIVGLGWGRATRAVTIADAVRGRDTPTLSVDALGHGEENPTVGDPTIDDSSDAHQPIGERGVDEARDATDLFDPDAAARVVFMQNVVPALATGCSFLTFEFLLAV